MTTSILSNLSLRRPWYSMVNGKSLRADAIAGFTNAAIVLPQGVAFAVIAGLPPEYGLYTAMITPVIAALWGSSMIMVSGPTTAISAVLFAAVSQLAPAGTPAYVDFALVLTVMVGIFQLIGGLCRLGALISFISQSVMIGFTAATAVLIGASQLGGAFGLSVPKGGGVVGQLGGFVERVADFSPVALTISLSTFATLLICNKISKRLPIYLIALAVGIGVGELVDARANGIAMFSALPSITPTFSMPDFSIQKIALLAPSAVSIAFIGLLGTISIGRSFAMRRGERYDANQDIVGQGLSNIVGGFVQCYAGAGSFTRSALNAESGARTPISAVFAAVFLMGLLFLVAPVATRIPVPAMAGIILYVAYRLVSLDEIRHIVSSSRSETMILTVTFVTGVTTNLQACIAAGVIASLMAFIHRSAKPNVAALAPATFHGRRQLRDTAAYPLRQCPQILILRVEGSLFFGSVESIEREFHYLERQHSGPTVKVLVLHGVGHIDMSMADLLVEEIKKTRARGGDYHIVTNYGRLIATLRRMHVLDILGEDKLHASKSDALEIMAAEVDPSRCATCKVRCFLECARQPAPIGVLPMCEPPKIDKLKGGPLQPEKVGLHFRRLFGD